MKKLVDIKFGDDIGHGTDTKGKGYAEFKEHTFNSTMGIKYKQEMEKVGFISDNIIMAQLPHSLEVPLYKRYEYYDYLDFYISLHADANNSHSANGVTIYYWKGSEKGLILAKTFKEAFLSTDIDIRFRAIDESDTDSSDGDWDNFGILREPKSPGILIEHGFFTNDHDRMEMSKESVQDKFVKAWVEASIVYLIKMDILDPSELGKGEIMNERVDIKILSNDIIITDCELHTLYKLKNVLAPYEIVTDKNYYNYVGYDLKYSTIKSTDVAILQTVLKELSAVIVCDGYYGFGTEGIVLDMFGSRVVTRTVANEINAALIEKRDGIPESKPPVNSYKDSVNGLQLPQVILEYGSLGNDVRNLQIVLTMIGFTLGIDGSFGNECKTILNEYRNKHGLEENGKYDMVIHNLLGKEILSKKTIYYRSGNVYYAEIHKDNLHGRKEMVNGYQFDDMIDENEGYANAVFRWDASGITHAQSPFVADGVTLSNRCIENYNAGSGWLGDKMPHFIIKKDGEVSVEITNNIKAQVDVDFAVGGIKMYPKVDYVGFKSSNIGSLAYATKRHAIAYNATTDRVLIAYTAYMTIDGLATSINGKGYINTVGLDSGGSSQLDLEITKRNTTRRMACWIVFEK